MKTILILAILYSSIISKTIPANDCIKITSDSPYRIERTSSKRIIVETKYSNSEALQKYIKKRYAIKTIVNDRVTHIIINKPKAKIIYHGKEIEEKFFSIIYVPDNVHVK